MSFDDAVRWIAIWTCLFNVGALMSLYFFVGRLFVPKVWMRTLMTGYSLSLLSLATAIHSHLGQPLSFRAVLYTLGLIMQLVAWGGLWHWYGTDEGRDHVRQLVDDPGRDQKKGPP